MLQNETLLSKLAPWSPDMSGAARVFWEVQHQRVCFCHFDLDTCFAPQGSGRATLARLL